jgi:putative ATP-dependent endonuclease of OLD family
MLKATCANFAAHRSREGISVIPIYGIHFDVYAKLFSKDALPKKCAIITDGDLKPSDADPALEGEDDLPRPPDPKALQNEYVRVFACQTTFERALVLDGTLEMFARAADDIGAPTVAKRLREGAKSLAENQLDEKGRNKILAPLRKMVLNTAKRFGKARFAQVTARYADQAEVIPQYLADAAKWLIAP